ncbi:MAG: glycosyltransferase family 4 protein, partial [Bdellovibrionales bacterium]|nr:glycosyltransferase family 4 protein [Bdellovibrionales bacterium]
RNQPLFDARWKPFFNIALKEHFKRDPLYAVREQAAKAFPALPQGPKAFDFTKELVEPHLLSQRAKASARHAHLLKDVEVVFLLPNIVPHGGSLSVLQHVNELLMRGVEARVVALQQREPLSYPLLTGPIILSPEEFVALPWDHQKVIATIWSTAYLVKAVTLRAPHTTGYYYIQDYEPWFYPGEHQTFEREHASSSYELGLHGVAKTTFLKEAVESRHPCHVSQISPGIADTVFYPGNQQDHIGRPRIAALFRPSVPRRGASELLELLSKLTQKCPEVEITLFGETGGISSELAQRVNLVGTLSQSEVAELYRQSDVCIDLSQWHGFGRMGIESMACGVVPLLSNSGGISEYAKHNENSIIVDRNSPDEVLSAALRLLFDRTFRMKLREEALRTASTYSEENATSDWIKLFQGSSAQDSEQPPRYA